MVATAKEHVRAEQATADDHRCNPRGILALASDITADDLELTLSLMREAATLATRLGIESPKMYVKSPERVGVGYLHVHVVGCRDPGVPYPPALK